MKTLSFLRTIALAAALAIAATTANAADTFMVKLQGLLALPRTPEVPTVALPDGIPQYIDLRAFTGLRYQLQGASCGVSGCNDYDIPVTLYVSFDDGSTWAPIGAPGAGAVVHLTPRSLTYSPPLRPTTMITIPTNQRRNNAILRSMVDYTEKPYATVSDQWVQFYR